MKTLILISLFVLGSMVRADDLGLTEKVRLRAYDGGVDEQPLQVQTTLYNSKIEIEKIGEGDIAPVEAAPAVDETPSSDGE